MNTPTPWLLDPANDCEIRSSNDYPVACFNTVHDAKRTIICVNAMHGIEDPQKLRETWDAIKHLELDQFYVLQEKYNRLSEQYVKLLEDLERSKY